MFKDPNNNYRLKIAFDYDDTLTQLDVFTFAKRLISCGHDVWIMTARIEKDDEYTTQCKKYGIIPDDGRNADLFKVAKKLGVPREKIIFTNLQDKSTFYKEHEFDLLFDDDDGWHISPVIEAGGVAVKV
jgi:hypothetical protein